jgi:hypothetical protein
MGFPEFPNSAPVRGPEVTKKTFPKNIATFFKLLTKK